MTKPLNSANELASIHVLRRSGARTCADLEADLLERLDSEGLRSLKDVRAALNVHLRPAFGPMRPDELDAVRVARVLSAIERDSSRSVGDRCKWVMVRLWDLAVELGHADPNRDPVRNARWKRRVKPSRRLRASAEVLSLEEVRLVIRSPALPLERRRLWALLLLTGMRLGEAAELRVSDVKDASPLRRIELSRAWCDAVHDVTTPKTGDSRHVPLHPLLAEWLPRGGLVAKPNGRERWLDGVALKWWHRDLETLGIAARRLHATRHTFISRLLAAGAPRMIVQEFTHRPDESESAFLGYAHLEWPQKCAAILRLEV